MYTLSQLFQSSRSIGVGFLDERHKALHLIRTGRRCNDPLRCITIYMLVARSLRTRSTSLLARTSTQTIKWEKCLLIYKKSYMMNSMSADRCLCRLRSLYSVPLRSPCALRRLRPPLLKNAGSSLVDSNPTSCIEVLTV